MRASELEMRVLQVVDDVTNGKRVEDSRIELKTEWPAPDWKTARRLGGHANAAFGDPIVWLVGIDEGGARVVSVEPAELANWWPQVQKCFHEIAPELALSLNVPTAHGSVVALLFNTTRAPFVINVPTDGPVDREVPWREGARTLSAKREHLIRVLVPQTLAPKFNVLQARAIEREPANKTHARWTFDMRLYVTPADARALYFPLHDFAITLRFAPNVEIAFDRNLIVRNHERSGIELSSTEVIVRGPGLLEISVMGESAKDLVGYGLEPTFAVIFHGTNGERHELSGLLIPDERLQDGTTWKYAHQRDLPHLGPL